MRKREQSGYLFKRRGRWVLRYGETINQSGVLKTVMRSKQLQSTNKLDAKTEADEILQPLNNHAYAPETAVTIRDFVTQVYLPFVKAQKRSTTSKGYREMWHNHLDVRCGNMMVRKVRTFDIQQWIESIANEARTRKGDLLRRNTLKRIKGFVSGIFSHAKRQGFFDGANPVEDTAIPPAPEREETYAYSLEEINRMLLLLPEPARTIAAVASFTGARRSEIEGMEWENYHDGAIYISRSITNGKVSAPKTRASKAPIPVVPTLAAILEKHRARLGNPISGPMFPSESGTPLWLNNVLTRQIKPALSCCAVCSKTSAEHTAEVEHRFERDKSLPEWHGWHSFRRGLATNLNRLGVQDKTIQAILRHSELATTMNIYVKTVAVDSVTALNTLEGLMCPKRTPDEQVVVN